MAEAKRRLFHLFKASHKLALLSGGILLVLGASGTAALVFAPQKVLPGYEEEAHVSTCKTVYQSEFRRGAEKRLIAVISSNDIEPRDRVRTGVRIARHLADTLHPDLVIVQVSDHRGPVGRAQLRGSAIGAEIVHAPVPTRTLATSEPWEVRYIDKQASESGYFFGKRVGMPLPAIEAVEHEIALVEGCNGDLVEAEAETASAGGHGAPEKPAKSAGH